MVLGKEGGLGDAGGGGGGLSPRDLNIDIGDIDVPDSDGGDIGGGPKSLDSPTRRGER